ncbi:MAG: hydantoinase/oxoprolinase N-terminal domain-containing protein [Thermoleophilia bacterium]
MSARGLDHPRAPVPRFAASPADAASTLGVEPGALLAEATVLVYGTTCATNAIVEGTVARTALLVTEGFPDVLSYRQGGKHNPFELSCDFLRPTSRAA